MSAGGATDAADPSDGRAGRPRVLTVGGVDPSGGAGITADARMIQARGADAATVPASLTVQSAARFVRDEPVAPELLREMLDAVLGDGPVDAIKTGWFADARSVEVFADWLSSFGHGQTAPAARVPLVVDPVLGSTAGGIDTAPRRRVLAALVEHLAIHTAVVTPNRDELCVLAVGAEPTSLLERGFCAVLVKDGHGAGATAVDRLFARDRVREFPHQRIERGPVHGTGCAVATALACHLASGHGLEDACARAIADVERCLRATPPSRPGRAAPLRIV